MAYGKEPLRPAKGAEAIKPLSYPEGKKIQQGKQGIDGADKTAVPDFGGMPSSGNFQPNAGQGGEQPGAQVVHHPVKDAKKPGPKGGAKVGSVDTLTKLIFHPKGGLAGGKSAKSPQGSGGFKDSGQKKAS